MRASGRGAGARGSSPHTGGGVPRRRHPRVLAPAARAPRVAARNAGSGLSEAGDPRPTPARTPHRTPGPSPDESSSPGSRPRTHPQLPAPRLRRIEARGRGVAYRFRAIGRLTSRRTQRSAPQSGSHSPSLAPLRSARGRLRAPGDSLSSPSARRTARAHQGSMPALRALQGVARGPRMGTSAGAPREAPRRYGRAVSTARLQGRGRPAAASAHGPGRPHRPDRAARAGERSHP